jgi:alpha-amylase
MLGTWVSQLISNYSSRFLFNILSIFPGSLTVLVVVDGLRIDSVLNIPPVFFPSFNSSAGVFCLGEGATMNAANICPLQSGLNGLLNYPL